MIKVGILSFSDGRKRVHDSLAKYIGETQETLKQTLVRTGEVEAHTAQEIAWNPEIVREQVRALLAGDPDALIFNVQVFAFPNLSAIAARLTNVPVLAYCTRNPTLPGLGGVQAAVNMIRQQGMHCSKLWGNCEDPQDLERIMAFLRAAHAATRLRGQVYGLFGGRSIGMGSGAVNPDLWMKVFGVDVDHIDELEIIRRSDLVDQAEVDKAMAWLQERMRAINFDDNKLTRMSLERQVRTYVATRQIIEDRKLDFAGVKCHYDMSEYFVTQCMSAAFFNDPYDWNGPKEPFVLSCEADSDGALTMQIMHLISRLPVLFIDLRYYNVKEDALTLCNCGSMATWYAARSEDPAENLAGVSASGIIPKYGGEGAHIHFMAREGDMTLARLTRVLDRYTLTVFKGQCVRFPEEKMAESAPVWPHAFMKLPFPFERLIERFDNNHLHVVSGDWVAELSQFCELAGIELNLVE
ncbi:L-fucose isomerase [Candidatus Uhrbacteria bacterium]|nr:L-fucose isomerase [Candidatus Uhrbacteria bacterium]